MEISIRPANPSDLNWLVGQLRKFSAHYGSEISLFGDEEYVRAAMLGMMENHLVLVADKGSPEGIYPVGFISGIVTPHMFNPKIKHLCETFWWVDEEHRGSKAGLKLLNAFNEWGEKNANWITFFMEEKGLTSGHLSDNCLIKRGYRPVERSYLKEIP